MKKRGPHVLYDLNDLLFSLHRAKININEKELQIITIRQWDNTDSYAEAVTYWFLNSSWIENSDSEVATSSTKCLHDKSCRIARCVSYRLQPYTGRDEYYS